MGAGKHRMRATYSAVRNDIVRQCLHAGATCAGDPWGFRGQSQFWKPAAGACSRV